LEYNEKHISWSAIVAFPLVESDSKVLDGTDEEKVSVAIWTTTPWTIAANKAILVNPDFRYSLLQTQSHGRILIEQSRIDYLKSLLKEEVTILKDTIPGDILTKARYRHPLLSPDSPPQPILAADFVTSDTGTGLVHCAPGHGMEDYLVCQKHGIKPFSPVDDLGRYTSEAIPGSDLAGKPVLDEGNRLMFDMLSNAKVLLAKEKYAHKYPYDWRTKQPVIVRATAQWFAGVEDIKTKATAALQNVKFHPEQGLSRLQSFVNGRNEWCISRQRSWGVPIPALYDRETGEPLLTKDSVNHIIGVFKEHGTEIWWRPSDEKVDNEIWVAPQYRNNGKIYEMGKETMDVWFDSGTSWKIIEENIERSPSEPLADVYLEGSDQHRGWFQSSLLTYIASQSGSNKAKAPFRNVITHGFVLDEKNRKMSKSLGNVVSPEEIINGNFQGTKVQSGFRVEPGVDTLRFWVASSDYTKDVSVGVTNLKHVLNSVLKIRNTVKYLLGNLHDWDGQHVPYNSLLKIDKYALYQLYELNATVRAAYDENNFSKGNLTSQISSY